MKRERYRELFVRLAAALFFVAASLLFFPQAAEASGQEEKNIHIEAVENGTVEADRAYAQEGEQVTLTVTPGSGQALGYLEVTGSTDGAGAVKTQLDKSKSSEKVQSYTFTMPAYPVRITGSFGPQRKQQIWMKPGNVVKDGKVSIRMYDKEHGTEAFSKRVGSFNGKY